MAYLDYVTVLKSYHRTALLSPSLNISLPVSVSPASSINAGQRVHRQIYKISSLLHISLSAPTQRSTSHLFWRLAEVHLVHLAAK